MSAELPLTPDELRSETLGDRHVFRSLLPYIRLHKSWLISAIIALLLSTAVDLSIPYFTRFGIDQIIDRAYATSNELDPAFRQLFRFSLFFMVLILAQFFFEYAQVFFSNQLGQKVIYDLRQTIFQYMMQLPTDYFSRTASGKITTRVVMDTKNLSNFFSEVLTSLTKDIAIISGVIILMYKLNVKLSLYTTAIFPVIFLTTWGFKRLDRRAYETVRARVADLNAFLAENIAGSQVSRLFNLEAVKQVEFEGQSEKLYQAKIHQMIVFSIFNPFMNFLYYTTLSIILWFGSKGIREGFLSFGTLYAFNAYLSMFFNPLFDMTEKYDILQNAFASARKLFALLHEKQEDDAGEDIHRITEGRIEFREVWFTYPRSTFPVLRGIDADIPALRRIAIVGETGSGKTTWMKLLNRLYDVDSGEILIDGIPVKNYSLSALRRGIAMTPQEVFLFSGTVNDNIRLYDPVFSEDDIQEAARQVFAHELIMRLSQGYSTQIVERGATLSSGERQLIALARAALFQAKIIVLDEATANIDVKTESLIRQALINLSQYATIISIAHRLSTVRDADTIFVMHKGKLVEKGKHEELLSRKSFYYSLYQLQFEPALS